MADAAPVGLGVVGLAALALIPKGSLLFGGLLFFKRLAPTLNRGITPFTGADLCLLAWLLRTGTALLLRRKKSRPIILTVSDRLLLALLAWAWLSTVLHGVSRTPLARITLYAAVGIFLKVITDDSRRWVIRGVTIYVLIEMIMTVSELFRSRLFGHSIGDPQQFGSLLLAALAMLLGGVVLSNQRRVRRIAILGTVAWILGTETRGIWLALLVMLTLACLRNVNRRKALTIMTGAFMVGWALYGPVTSRLHLNTHSIQVRTQSLASGYALARTAPLTGRGWAWDAKVQQPILHSAYNFYVNVWGSLGVIGFALLLCYLYRLLKEESAMVNRSAFLYTAGMIAFGMGEMIWFAGSFPTLLFFLLPAIGLLPDAARGSTPAPSH